MIRYFAKQGGWNNSMFKVQFNNLSLMKVDLSSYKFKNWSDTKEDIFGCQVLPTHQPGLILLPDSVEEFSVP
jgi:hypothetical protein